jgi:signal transduction histidine kinase/ActR/RegA family two-component response regulator
MVAARAIEPDDVSESYREALATYLLHGEDELGLLRAYDCGRQALSQGMNLLDLVAIHHQATLDTVLGPVMHNEGKRLSVAADEFFRQALAPYELTRRGFAEANSRLKELNATLEQRVSERTEALSDAADRLQALNDFARAVSSSLDVESLLRIIMNQLPALTSCKWCAITEYDREEKRFVVRSNWMDTFSEVEMTNAELSVEESASGLVLQQQEPLIAQVTRDHVARSVRTLAGQGIGSLICLPIWVSSDLWGTLGVGFAETSQITPERTEFLAAICSHFAVGVHNAELHGRLQAAYDQLQRSQDQIVQHERLRALGQMASGIAHDFNNALAPVLGFTELLLARPNDLRNEQKVHDHLELIHAAAQDAASIVGRLREFYRSREQQEVLVPVDLNQIVKQSVMLTQPRWRDQMQGDGRQVTVETDLDEVPLVAGNEAELREVLTNLIFNAVDAMPEGGKVTLSTHPEEEHVCLQIADTGMGMSEEVRRQCFEPFFTTKGERGTGLGLGMVYGIVQRHGGTIDLKSKLGKGTTFSIRLPLRAAPIQETEEPPATVVVTPLRILIADDDARIRQFITESLLLDGHTVEPAADGRAALELLGKQDFQLLITDRGMPGLSGDQLAERSKQLYPHVPVILLTGFGDVMSALGEQPANVDAVVSKPVQLTDLWGAIARVTTASAEATPEAH